MSEQKARQVVYERSGRICERCGSTGPGSIHHRKNRSQMHKSKHWLVSVLSYLCGNGTQGCHGLVTENPALAGEEGLWVRPWQDPAEIPVLYRGRWAYLREDGSVEYTD